MSTRTAKFYSTPQTFETKHLFLSYSYSKNNIRMSLKINTPHISTKSFPKTYAILKEIVPSVLTSQCFNDQNIPFNKEVKNTEMGHLLEHILLEFLCVEKMNDGSEEADFSGETAWNWTRDPYGTFMITIECSFSDYIFFLPALEKSIQILEIILLSKEEAKVTYLSFQPTYPSVPAILS